MPKVEIRHQRISDAKDFYRILTNPNFKFFLKPKSLKEEIKFLRGNAERRKKKTEINFSILFNGEIVGGCGLKINIPRPFIGEIGYFLDEKYWNKGITTKTVRLLEKIAFKEYGIHRIEILMNPQNIASEKVAIKAGYTKEGTMKKSIMVDGKIYDSCLYAKVK